MIEVRIHRATYTCLSSEVVQHSPVVDVTARLVKPVTAKDLELFTIAWMLKIWINCNEQDH